MKRQGPINYIVLYNIHTMSILLTTTHTYGIHRVYIEYLAMSKQ